jgi:glutamyl-tRNA reductase
VLVANRSFERAEALATEFGGRAVRMEDCFSAMADVDIVVSSTGCPGTVLHRTEIEAVMKSRRSRRLVLIDIAVPRDIEPEVQSVNGVYLYNIDDLEALVRENVKHRELGLEQCRAILERRTAEALAKLAPRRENAYDPQVETRPEWAFCGTVACGS